MAKTNPFLQHFKMQHPIIQAPLAGGGDTPELLAAVCNAGGLGFVGAAYLTPQQITETCRTIRGMTARPFGINLFAPLASPSETGKTEAALARVAPYFSELGLPTPSHPAAAAHTFEDQLAAALASDASAFSFTFGIPPEGAVQSIKNRGMYLLGTATTVDEAVQLE